MKPTSVSWAIPARNRDVYNFKRAIPRMSWSAENTYNMWQTTHPDGPQYRNIIPKNHTESLFKQRWRAKRYLRGLYGDMVTTKKFERWFLPDKLPSINPTTEASVTPKQPGLARIVEGRTRAGGRTEDIRRRAQREFENTAPVGSLMFQEIERRLDVCVFRACFAQSVYQARQYVARGHVKLNGQIIKNPNITLEPGDIFTVNPSVIQMLKKPAVPKIRQEALEGEGSEGTEATEATEQAVETTADDSSPNPSSSASDSDSPSSSSPSTESSSSPTSKASSTSTRSPSSRATRTLSTPSSAATSWFSLPDFAQTHLFVPNYILPSFLTCSAVYVRHPTARPQYSEIPSPFDAGGFIMSLGWEWFHRKAPRMRGRRLKWVSPQRRHLKEQIPRQ